MEKIPVDTNRPELGKKIVIVGNLRKLYPTKVPLLPANPKLPANPVVS